MYRGQVAVCKIEITLFAEQLTRTFEVLVFEGIPYIKNISIHLIFGMLLIN